MTWAEELGAAGACWPGRRGNPRQGAGWVVGELYGLGRSKSQCSAGSGPSCNHEVSGHSRHQVHARDAGNGKKNEEMLVKRGQREELVCWFPKAFKKLFILVSLEAPVVQADLTCPKGKITSYSTAIDKQELQPGNGMGSLQDFSGKLVEAFQGKYMESATDFPTPQKESLKGKGCAPRHTEGSWLELDIRFLVAGR